MTESIIVLINPNNKMDIGYFSNFNSFNKKKQLSDEDVNKILPPPPIARPPSPLYPGSHKSIIRILREENDIEKDIIYDNYQQKQGCLYYPGIQRSIIHYLK